MEGSASRMTLPPSPPSPPSGPPRGMYFSRRKLTHPAPPSPPLTKTSTSSTNIAGSAPGREARRASSDGLLGDADVLVVALALEEAVTVGSHEQRVIDAHADIGARLEAGTALADQDATGGDELTAEPLHPEHLGIRIAAVAGAPDTLLVRHDATPRYS